MDAAVTEGDSVRRWGRGGGDCREMVRNSGSGEADGGDIAGKRRDGEGNCRRWTVSDYEREGKGGEDVGRGEFGGGVSGKGSAEGGSCREWKPWKGIRRGGENGGVWQWTEEDGGGEAGESEGGDSGGGERQGAHEVLEGTGRGNREILQGSCSRGGR